MAKVEWKSLDDVLSYEQPTKYIVKSNNYINDGKIPVLTAGQTFILGHTNENNNICEANSACPVIIFDDFTTSFHWVDFSFKVKSSAMKILRPREGVIFKYIFYAMSCINHRPVVHARQWISTYSKLRVPIPPVEKQREIVDTLDKFTSLTASLTAEKELRVKQYTHFRNKLLTFNAESCAVKLVELAEAFVIKNGYTPSKDNLSFWQDGIVPWFRMDDIRENGRILSDSIQHITPEAVKGRLFPKNSIIMATSATIGEHALITVPSLANQRFSYFILKESYKDKINMRFFFYYCFLIGDWCRDNVNAGNFASVDMPRLKKLKIPVPPLEEQERIAGILDKFDAYVNDISQGLPAEIIARQKQYEYYRHKLFAFEGKPQ